MVARRSRDEASARPAAPSVCDPGVAAYDPRQTPRPGGARAPNASRCPVLRQRGRPGPRGLGVPIRRLLHPRADGEPDGAELEAALPQEKREAHLASLATKRGEHTRVKDDGRMKHRTRAPVEDSGIIQVIAGFGEKQDSMTFGRSDAGSGNASKKNHAILRVMPVGTIGGALAVDYGSRCLRRHVSLD